NPSEGNAALTFNFYRDSARTMEVDGASYQNIANPQTIYVKATNINTGCFSYTELTLTVSITDVNDLILPTVCDDDGVEDGLHVFNLKDAELKMLENIPATGLVISYYETYDDALLEINKLNPNYTNTQAYSQTIYARVENANACYGISKIGLVVNKLPNVQSQSVIYYCLNKSPEYITLNAELIGDDPNNYTYRWSNGDTSYDTQVNDVGNYSVLVTSKISGCSKTRNITVEASDIATFKEINITD